MTEDTTPTTPDDAQAAPAAGATVAGAVAEGSTEDVSLTPDTEKKAEDIVPEQTPPAPTPQDIRNAFSQLNQSVHNNADRNTTRNRATIDRLTDELNAGHCTLGNQACLRAAAKCIDEGVEYHGTPEAADQAALEKAHRDAHAPPADE